MFVNERKHCDGVAKLLNAEHLRCGVLHAGRSQDAREETLTMFRNGQLHVLIATDVAGRGLDIPDVEHVVNFNMATEISKYCHRIGRTGRAGKSGVATTFLTDHDEEVRFRRALPTGRTALGDKAEAPSLPRVASAPPSPPNQVFYDLKAYLESTGAAVPHQLASHAAAKAAPGARNDRGELINKSRDKVQYAKK